MKLEWCCLGVLLSAANAGAQSTVRAWNGGVAGEHFGASISIVGDVDADGRDDLAVGSPHFGANGAEVGRVIVLSGRTGLRIRTWEGAANAKHFGAAIVGAGDVDGDGRGDVLVGAATWLGPTGALGALTRGYVRLISGGDGAVLRQFDAPPAVSNFGAALASGADFDGDNVDDLLIGAPGDYSSAGAVYLFSGASGVQIRRDRAPQGRNFGSSLAVLGDVNNDGVADYLAGAPFALSTNNFAQQTPGWVFAIDGLTGGVLWQSSGASPGEQSGWSLARSGDLDGDGIADAIVGGRSGGGGGAGCPQTLGCHVRVLSGRTGATIRAHVDTQTCRGYGTAVASLPDVNGDGFDEYAASAPGWRPGLDASAETFVYDGRLGQLLAVLATPAGSPTSAWGFALTVGDANGDGLVDLVASAPWSDALATDAGSVRALTIVRRPTPYCVAQTNSLQCTPAINSNGTPSASQATPFVVGAANVLNQRSGLLFYGFAPQEVPFHGGKLCVASPLRRTLVQLSGGAALPALNCSGAFALDFNARIQTGIDPALVPGAEVFAQYWSRDPAAPSTTNLTDALAFFVRP
jgi:hypothetical protein